MTAELLKTRWVTRAELATLDRHEWIDEVILEALPWGVWIKSDLIQMNDERSVASRNVSGGA